LLVLDEPTNDLDLETLDLLQEVIADYDGTVLIVSHDRDFLDRTVTLTLGLQGDGKVDIIPGGYADWEAKRDDRSKDGASKKTNTPKPAAKAKPTPAAKLSYKDQRDYDEIPTQISEIEEYIAGAEKALADPELYSRDPKTFEALTAMIEKKTAEKDAAEERWLDLATMVEEIEAS